MVRLLERWQEQALALAVRHDEALEPDPDETADERQAAAEGHVVCALPRGPQLRRVVARQLLLLAPLGHPLLVLLLILRGRIGAAGVRGDLVIGGHVVAAVLCRGHRSRCAGLVWEWALARHHVVQPLCKETPVQRDLAAVRVGDGMQLRPQLRVELQGPVALEVRHVADEANDVLWRCCRRAHGALNVTQGVLALVDAADEVVRTGHDAVGGRLQVVRDDHLLARPGRGLVQGAELAQVRLRLCEAPLAVEIGTVEVGQAHAACAALVHSDERGLDVLALALPERREVLTDVADHLVSVLEGEGLRQGILRCAGVLAVVLNRPNGALDEARDAPPLREGLLEQRLVASHDAV
mmetsp:Transcript_97658/g.252711  ORF Transcript_97658/g.252711 Transcript_97658/m.252711 type:complete len:353 (+) Transcript_97658:154-1212(+)